MCLKKREKPKRIKRTFCGLFCPNDSVITCSVYPHLCVATYHRLRTRSCERRARREPSLMASPSPSSHLSLLAKPSPPPRPLGLRFQLPPSRSAAAPSLSRPAGSRFRCSASQTGFFTRLGRLIKEKAKSDVEKIVSGFSKTRENLAVIDELLLYWNLADTDRILDELEEVLSL